MLSFGQLLLRLRIARLGSCGVGGLNDLGEYRNEHLVVREYDFPSLTRCAACRS